MYGRGSEEATDRMMALVISRATFDYADVLNDFLNLLTASTLKHQSFCPQVLLRHCSIRALTDEE